MVTPYKNPSTCLCKFWTPSVTRMVTKHVKIDNYFVDKNRTVKKVTVPHSLKGGARAPGASPQFCRLWYDETLFACVVHATTYAMTWHHSMQVWFTYNEVMWIKHLELKLIVMEMQHISCRIVLTRFTSHACCWLFIPTHPGGLPTSSFWSLASILPPFPA